MNHVLVTNAGYWSPLVWVAAFAIVTAIALLIRSRGEKGCRHGTEQSLPFFSGNEPTAGNIHASNLYWGFVHGLARHYRLLARAHSGVVNDYAFSLVVLAVVLMAALIVGGMA
ncbi:MAG: hydrogenase [Candidatus Aenigmarchaeota archaeon]|nr:hydrogenase [Candidatus Aenigmarchaeota archaeon]